MGWFALSGTVCGADALKGEASLPATMPALTSAAVLRKCRLDIALRSLN